MIWDRQKLKPETADDVRETETIQGKRKRLNRYAYDNPLVRAVFTSAEYQGLSGEDTMTWLAYEALLRVEQLEAVMLDDLCTRPAPPIIFTTPLNITPHTPHPGSSDYRSIHQIKKDKSRGG